MHTRDWDNYGDERVQLRCEELLTSFDLPPRYHKHEFFKRLILKLVKEGYAQNKDNREYRYEDLNDFQKNTIITVEGYYFITEENGYTQQKINQDAENNRLVSLENHQRRHRTQLFWLTLILAVSGIGAMFYYGTDLYWEHGWFRSCFWWSVSVVVIVLTAGTTYLVWRLLQRKQRGKQ